jgi:DNA-binding response OmpR family regulator
VLVVEDDSAIAEVLHAVLRDEGYRVSMLGAVGADAVRTAVGRLEPDCVVLDGESPRGYGSSWGEAAWLQGRSRTVPVVMLTGHTADVREAREGESVRSQAAGFVGVVAKPFDLDELVAAVGRAVGEVEPFDASHEADAARSARLGDKLRAAGLSDVTTSPRREWATFTSAASGSWLLYWSQQDGVYFLVRERRPGAGYEQVGRFYDLDAAVEVARAVGADG